MAIARRLVCVAHSLLKNQQDYREPTGGGARIKDLMEATRHRKLRESAEAASQAATTTTSTKKKPRRASIQK